ncbi:MAG: hypothetical protein ACR2P5_07480 [Gammaproteobacteria bacterium]
MHRPLRFFCYNQQPPLIFLPANSCKRAEILKFAFPSGTDIFPLVAAKNGAKRRALLTTTDKQVVALRLFPRDIIFGDTPGKEVSTCDFVRIVSAASII